MSGADVHQMRAIYSAQVAERIADTDRYRHLHRVVDMRDCTDAWAIAAGWVAGDATRYYPGSTKEIAARAKELANFSEPGTARIGQYAISVFDLNGNVMGAALEDSARQPLSFR